MTVDTDAKVLFAARQFDHWGPDSGSRASELNRCFEWIGSVIGEVKA
jgi:hypothetical protein